LHVLPQLRELELRFPHQLAVVGVHSGKYIAERDTARIREATRRLDVDHPVVNDRQYRVWRSFAVRAWPSLVVVDPTGAVLGAHAGEFTAEMLGPLIQQLIQKHELAEHLGSASPEGPPEQSAIAPGVLRYPGKVAVSGDRMAIADTGHHRVLVGTLDDGDGRPVDGHRMLVQRVVGDGEPGFVDGSDARFHAPNGLAFDGDTLLVADTENHAVRAVDLASGVTRTVAGTGRQLRTRRERADGAMSSPWDVAVVGGGVYVAMAGTHQLWALRGDSGRPGADIVAGTGAEDIADGHAGDARLAQPMGMAPSVDGRRLYFVDAESSAARWLTIDERPTGRPTGEVHTIVGTGLFDFGDRDGIGDDVRLQHPQGVAIDGHGRLLVADSYNDAVKRVDPETRRVETLLRGFHEPGGLAYHPGRAALYIADTNAHRIAIVDERTQAVSTLHVAGALDGGTA
jgi:DNA-binding beta-propeller fold protein YncE